MDKPNELTAEQQEDAKWDDPAYRAAMRKLWMEGFGLVPEDGPIDLRDEVS